LRQARWKLDAALQIGIDDIEAGRYLPIDEAFDEVFSRLGLE
jgi:antitoxin ParD1/3/4